jgi:hypothetical protein
MARAMQAVAARMSLNFFMVLFLECSARRGGKPGVLRDRAHAFIWLCGISESSIHAVPRHAAIRAVL